MNSYQYTPNQELKILTFEMMTEDLLNFIVVCRNGQAYDHDALTTLKFLEGVTVHEK